MGSRDKNEIRDISQVDSYVKVSTPSTYIALAALSVLFVALFVWFFFGKVSDISQIKGVIFPSQGTVAVDLPHKGLVRTVFVHKGDAVSKGQQLALVSIDGSYSIVSAPADGTVLSYLIEGESFEPFEGIVNILPQDNSEIVNTVVALADFKASRDIRVGQKAQITPTYDSRERIGYIKGTIDNVVPYPISREEAAGYFENKSIVDEIYPNSGAVFFVGIKMDIDPKDPTSLQWSFRNSGDLDTGVGTYCDIQVITKSRSMFKYLFEGINEKKHELELLLK